MNLDDQFNDIRVNYFPNWDKACHWKLDYGTRTQTRGNTGYCDSAAKMIYLDSRTVPRMSDAGQVAFIIHEICHEVGAAYHNRGWAERMEKAAQRAEILDQVDVARIIRSEIYSYFGNGLTLEYNSAGIHDYAQEVVHRNSEITFDELIRKTSNFFGYRASKISRDFGDEIRSMIG
ncbi:MAG: hypothetical protein JWP89_309 [Schlesneria sp.]|nr:hypothetical protein [Schlesneria sp.]